MRRCKLISPTNLMLETPILSPVEECEYVLFGKKEFEKAMHQVQKEWFCFGILCGFALGGLFVALLNWLIYGHR